jgi:[acyl-carrier-protein] S-malonyltransferase
MSKTAFILPGQGSQYVGLGNDLYAKNPIARELFEKADDILGVPLSKICFAGPQDELRQTKNTQPAIFLHSIILSKLIGRDDVAMVAGHSLGEYSALVFAGALTFEDGLKLVRLRGELMHRAGEEQKGTMAAVVGLEGVHHVIANAAVGKAGRSRVAVVAITGTAKSRKQDLRSA